MNQPESRYCPNGGVQDRPGRWFAPSGLALFVCFAAAVCSAGEYPLPPAGSDLVGAIRQVRVARGESLADVARSHNVGHLEIRAANPAIDFWLPEEGSTVVIPSRHILPPAERRGLVLNLPEMRLYYFPPSGGGGSTGTVITHPVSIGRMDWNTPLGETRVSDKVRNPSWTPPESVRAEARADGRSLPRVVPPGPDNPLGEFALRLTLPGYLIHGTNRPYGVGMRVTHGCIRMYPEDIELLYPLIDVGTRVVILDEAVKVGWSEGALYIEVHPALEEHDLGPDWLRKMALDRVEAATWDRPVHLSGRDVLRAIEERRGIPVRISRPVESSPKAPPRTSGVAPEDDS